MASSSALLSSFSALCEELHAKLGAGDETSAHDLVCRLLETDAHLKTSATALLRARNSRAEYQKLQQCAEDKQSALLALASRLHSADVRLAGVIERARDALAAADAGQASTRPPAPAATFVELAERVSYSNAAPCGQLAYEGAAKAGFYQGWGTPAPQQHMLAASHFATGRAATTAAAAAAAAATAAAPTEAEANELDSARPLADTSMQAPTFTGASVAPRAPPPAGRKRVSLDLDSDDDDEFE
jgi:hypothetical protein